VEQIDNDDDEDDDGGCHVDETELTLAGALEMLPIPCAIPGPSGMPAILLVNPSPAHSSYTTYKENDANNGGSSTADSAMRDNADGAADVHVAAATVSSTGSVLDRWSVAKLNYFYARYLPTKRRDRTGAWRERKATKTLAIVLGQMNIS